MKRRDFLKALVCGAASIVAISIIGVSLFTKKVIRAAHPGFWPGRIRNLRPNDIEKPGHWAG